MTAAMPRVLFLASPGWVPAPTDGGSPMISWSLLRAFADDTAALGFCSLIKTAGFLGAERSKTLSIEAGVSPGVWQAYGARGNESENLAFVTRATSEFIPDIIYCFGSEAAALASRAAPGALRIATFYDAPHAPAVHKFLSDLKDGGWRTRFGALRKGRDIYSRWRRYRATELPAIGTADIIVGHSWNNGREYERDLQRPVLYFPNPLSPVEVRREPTSPPVFVLAGAINSTVSRTGLRFLTREVLPHLDDLLKAGKLTIRVIGGGTLNEPFMDVLRSTAGVELTGYLTHDQLEMEYATCAAMLVPTPLPVGFRTRIVDAFRHGIPVVAHTANQAGFHDLKSGTNCYLASSGKEFAASVRMLVSEPAKGQAVAATALSEFETRYSVGAYRRFLLKAVADYRNAKAGL